MATHDYVISNQSFPSTRTDINNVLQAIVSNNSNATAPSTTYANMIWYDTANNKLYIRNEDNDAWIELFVLDQTGDHLEKIGDTITLDGSGNTGLGASTVDTLLHLSKTSGGAVIRLENPDTGLSDGEAVGKIEFETQDTGGAGVNAFVQAIGQGSGGANKLQLGTGQSGSTAVGLTIDKDQNIGIGQTSPTVKLDIDNGSVKVNRGNSAGDIAVFRGLNAEKFKIDTDGIKFNGDTAAANALDGYEEGTFTPTYAFSSGGGSFSYSIQLGYYTKVGRFVFVQIRIRGQKSGTGSGALQITGLPFTVPNVTNLFGTGAIGFTNNWVNRPMGAYIEANTDKVTLTKGANSSNTYSDLDTTVINADVDTNNTSSNDLILTISYIT